MQKQVKSIDFLLYHGRHINSGVKFLVDEEDIPMLVKKGKIPPEIIKAKVEENINTGSLKSRGKSKNKNW